MKDTFSISEKLIQQILRKHGLTPFTSVEEITTGLINPVFLINHSYILRVNTKQDAVSKKRFEKEAYLYPILSKSRVPVPAFIAHDKSCETIPHEYLILSYFEGETLTRAYKNAGNEAKCSLAFQLGELAKKIHSVDVHDFFLRSDLFGSKETWKQTTETEFETYFGLVKEKQLLPKGTIENIERVSNEFASLGNLSEIICLIHGDFSRNNIQIRDNEIVGIFDFEMAIIGDPYFDLQKLPINFLIGESFDKQSFWAGYGQPPISVEEMTRLRWYGIYQGLWEMWATETKKFPFGQNELQEGKTLISKALEM